MVRIQAELPNFMENKETQLCRNCVFYENVNPEDVCLNEKFQKTDLVTGKIIHPTCRSIRYAKSAVSSIHPQCIGYKDIRKEH